MVLLLVIFITNVPIRGLWSVVVVLLVSWRGRSSWFSWIGGMTSSRRRAQSHVYINVFGYLAISLPLLVFWLVVVLFFDRRTYMIFAPGQLVVRQDIGSGEVTYDTMGMVVAKRRSDLFRHWLLGFGSGDLLVKTAGAHSQQFEMHNVLFVGSKLHAIQDMLGDAGGGGARPGWRCPLRRVPWIDPANPAAAVASASASARQGRFRGARASAIRPRIVKSIAADKPSMRLPLTASSGPSRRQRRDMTMSP